MRVSCQGAWSGQSLVCLIIVNNNRRYHFNDCVFITQRGVKRDFFLLLFSAAFLSQTQCDFLPVPICVFNPLFWFLKELHKTRLDEPVNGVFCLRSCRLFEMLSRKQKEETTQPPPPPSTIKRDCGSTRGVSQVPAARAYRAGAALSCHPRNGVEHRHGCLISNVGAGRAPADALSHSQRRSGSERPPAIQTESAAARSFCFSASLEGKDRRRGSGKPSVHHVRTGLWKGSLSLAFPKPSVS